MNFEKIFPYEFIIIKSELQNVFYNICTHAGKGMKKHRFS